jgi:hypothetical protein
VEPKFKLIDKSRRMASTHLLRLERVKLVSSAAKLLGSLESVSINFMSTIFADERKRNSVRYCPNSSG